jgi:hypothetical protein
MIQNSAVIDSIQQLPAQGKLKWNSAERWKISRNR